MMLQLSWFSLLEGYFDGKLDFLSKSKVTGSIGIHVLVIFGAQSGRY